MRRVGSAIPAGHQALTRVTELYVRERGRKLRGFDRGFSDQKTSAQRAFSLLKEINLRVEASV
jgi:hypothetical protein